MKLGDLIELSSEFISIGCGMVLGRDCEHHPRNWPRILVLWNNGKIESMHEEDLVVINESR